MGGRSELLGGSCAASVGARKELRRFCERWALSSPGLYSATEAAGQPPVPVPVRVPVHSGSGHGNEASIPPGGSCYLFSVATPPLPTGLGDSGKAERTGCRHLVAMGAAIFVME